VSSQICDIIGCYLKKSTLFSGSAFHDGWDRTALPHRRADRSLTNSSVSVLWTWQTDQVDRLKAEGFRGQIMRDHTRRRAFKLAIEPKVVETERVLNGLIRALRDVLWPSAFSLTTWVVTIT